MQPQLRLTQGKAKRKVIPLEGKLVIGRVGAVDIPIADSKASREHARVFEQGGDWHIVDLNSTNGTQVNGAKITRRALRPGDEITIGQTVFVFEMPDAEVAEVDELDIGGESVETVAPIAATAAAPPTPPPTPTVRPQPKPKPQVSSTPVGAADEIVIKQKSLHYNRIEGKRTSSFITEDVGQRSGAYKLILWVVLGLVGLGIFFGAIYLGESLVSGNDDAEVYEEEYDEFDEYGDTE